MLSLIHQTKNLSKPPEVDSLLRFQRMPFEEGNNPFVEVIQRPDSVRHAIAVILSNDSTTEEPLQRVEQLDVTPMLYDREFRKHLAASGHLRVRVDADVETTFSVNESHHPLGF